MLGVRNNAIKEAYKKGYRVSDCGCEVTYKGRVRKLQNKLYKGKIYHRFSVRCSNKKSYNIMVHRLQAYQKYGEKAFKEELVVRHKNDNSLDNSRKNIVMGTQEQNMKDKARNAKKKRDVEDLPF